jgi:glycosyltransferase involved in cell wall biosynthesis
MVAGDGPQSAMVREATKQNSGADIRPLGWRSRNEIIDLIKGALFLVMPSESYEGFPLVIVEAFACGVPVIGSQIGGVGEVIRDGYSGLLFEAGNSTDLVRKVRCLWADRNLRDQLGRGARHQYESHYTARRNYAMMMEIFEGVLE